jgi:ferrochelatase
VADPARYDALLLLSFGGPEKRADVIPFLENVLRGRNVPHERLLAVAEHYYHFDGVSPINRQCRELIAALQPKIDLPIYWGNRNWSPLLADTMREMRGRGVKKALALATSAFGSYSGCRQYREDIAAARAAAPGAPEVDKIPPFWWHAGFIEAMSEQLRAALERLPGADVVYTAHSIPVAMAATGPYERQLREAAGLVHRRAGLSGTPVLVYQSRSGPPSQPWLEPDIGEFIKVTQAARLIVAPIGFLSDHIEVIYDLDVEVAGLAHERGVEMIRAATVGTHPRFVSGLADLIREAAERGIEACAPECCARPARG